MAFPPPPRRLLIFCDGTWCGRETGTRSNIQILAEEVGTIKYLSNDSPTVVHPIITSIPNTVAGYQEGIGLNKTFLEYLWDGATASTIGEECVDVYKWIVQHFSNEHDEIFMFGFSRGAYTVRSVAGMINNCGIIKPHGLATPDIETLCREVYRTYRSPLAIDHPKSTHCKNFRARSNNVWQNPRPIRAMFLGDTVGSMGIPRLNSGIGFDWPEFYDQKVSTVVQEVFHAVSLHDRLWVFQPCLVLPPDEDEAVKNTPEYNETGYVHDQRPKVTIHQPWFPGCHYDIGRQEFRFIRQAPLSHLEKSLGALPDKISRTIYPNEVLADLVLRWILEGVESIDEQRPVIPTAPARIADINYNLAFPTSRNPPGPTGSGDVYGDILSYGPAGGILSPLAKFGGRAVEVLNKSFPKLGDNVQDLLGIKTIVRILTATRDRRIPAVVGDDVYPYKSVERVRVASAHHGRGHSRRDSRDERDEREQRVEEIVIGEQARVAEKHGDGRKRYPSQTAETYELWGRVFGAVE
ncbi:hypothetical protein P154DRAFT_248075 [Amniculicola lignicola CBS 123094]|uniref:T6SS Phospholipase effector Tle1-like catalytic domain-containing protein n=1 Tax=Amniculicola lignicola CBS 123094 TaxID=1392246 RepID=A0A6A5WH44_9PLEO|nr:hypothetical protein P154DRAFT_248075 [Amniculicola lignicola CBS 123094]